MILPWPNTGRLTRGVLLALCLVGMLGCSSPTEQANKYYQKGLALMAQGDLFKAQIELQKALQIKPRLTPATYALAQIAEQQGEWDKLFSLLSQVVDRDPRHLEAQIKLARMLLMAGRLDNAQATSDTALALAANNAQVLGVRAGLLYLRHDVAAAVHQAKAALALNPENMDALIVLVAERLSANDVAGAVEYLDRSLRIKGRSMVLQLLKQPSIDALAQNDSAEVVLRKLIALYPAKQALRQALIKFYLLHNRAAAAEAEYQVIADENPTNLQARLDVVDFISATQGPQAARQYLQAYIAAAPVNEQLNFALVRMLQAQAEPQAAEAQLQAIIQRSGNGIDAINAKALLAGMWLAKGDKAAAQSLIREVLAGDQRNEEGLLLKAKLALDERQIDQAVADLRTILRDSPNSPRALLLQAKAHELNGAFALAQASYLRAYEAAKTQVQFGLAYSEFLLRQGQIERAETIARELLQMHPHHLAALQLLLQARTRRSDWLAAQAVVDEVSQLSGQQAVAQQMRNSLIAARQAQAQSSTALRRAYQNAAPEIRPRLANAQAYLHAGKVAEAMALLSALSKERAEDASILLLVGELQAAQGDTSAAALTFQRVIEMQPQQTLGYIQLARISEQAGHLDQAQLSLAQGLLQLPDNLELRMAQAAILATTGQVEHATKVYEDLLKSHPKSDKLVNNLVRLLNEHGLDRVSLQRAYDLAQRLRHSQLAQHKDTLGWASYRFGRVAEGAVLVESAVQQAPDNPEFRYHLGMIYAAQKQTAQARQELEKALALSQGHAFADAERARAKLLSL